MENNSSSLIYEGKEPIRLTKWKVKPGTHVLKGNILLLHCDDNITTEKKGNVIKNYKSNIKGTVKKLIAKEGDIIKPGDALLVLQTGCSHLTFFKDMCAECGAMLKDLNITTSTHIAKSVSMVHSVPDLRVYKEEAESIGQEDTKSLLNSKKLVLLVDLDQTLIHTTHHDVPTTLKDVFHFQLYGPRSPWFHTRVRPGTMTFLEHMSELYELHICTFGTRMYAHTLARGLLDPSGRYFYHRILSRDECFHSSSKTGNLKALFPCGDSLVCIIDDREDVWNYAPNMVPVKPYTFFSNTGDINCPQGLHDMARNDQVGSLKRKRRASSSSEASSCSASGPEEHMNEAKRMAPAKDEELSKNIDHQSNSSFPDDPNVSKSEILTENEAPLKILPDSFDPSKNEENDKEFVTKNDDKKEASLINEEKLIPIPNDDKREASLINKEKLIPMTNDDEKDAQLKDEEKLISKPNSENNGVISSSGLATNKNCKDSSNFVEESKEQAESDKLSEKPQSIDAIKQDANSFPSTDIEEKSDSAFNEQYLDEDNDDYLLYLEDILRKIHKRFFARYQENVDKGHPKAIPDLKSLIPQIKRETLAGVRLVFSGVIPTNSAPEKNRLWHLARSFGATIDSEVVAGKTTHLVAAKLGTAKVNKAQKESGGKIHLVSPFWLLSCAERWEHVSEKLFPLTLDTNFVPSRDLAQFYNGPLKTDIMMFDPEDNKKSLVSEQIHKTVESPFGTYDPKTGKRIDAKLHQPPRQSTSGANDSKSESSKTTDQPKDFSGFFSTFSSDILKEMNQEVSECCTDISSDSDSFDGDSDEDSKQASDLSKHAELLSKKFLENNSDSSSKESLTSGEFPRGWEETNIVDDLDPLAEETEYNMKNYESEEEWS